MGGPEVERLIALLAKLPGLGPRSARRAAVKMLQEPESRMLPLAVALAEAARAVKPCRVCGNLDSQDPCTICSNARRDRSVICVVLNSAKSQLAMPADRKFGSRRLSEPKV